MADAAQVIDKIIKLPESQKLIILGVVIVLLGVGYYYGIHTSKVQELSQKREELARLNSQHSEQQRVLANIDIFRQELRDMQVQFEESLKLLPNTSEIPALLTNISNLAQGEGLEVLLFRPEPEQARDFYAQIPVAMEVRGHYHDVAYFFDKVSKLDRIVNIENIGMQSSRRDRGAEASSQLDAKFTAITFRFLEAPKPQERRARDRRRR